MLADVTNASRGAKGFALASGATHLLEAGASARLDLADHPLHRAWVAAGEVAIAAVGEIQPPPPSPAPGHPRRRRRSG